MNIGLAADFYYPWIGGPATAIRNLSLGLHSRGHRVSLIVPSPTGPSFMEKDGGIEITRVATVPTPFGYRLRTALPPRGVGRWIDRTQPDVVHVHHPFPLSAAVVLAARQRQIPVVATNHTIPSCSLWGMRSWGPAYTAAHALLARWIVWLLRRCDAVATPTGTAAELLAELGFQSHISVISNGIDVDRFSPGPPNAGLRDRLGLDDRPIVLYTGRLDAEKEMGVWLRAAQCLNRNLDVQFVIGGEGTDRSRLEALAAQMGLSHTTHFIGYLTDEDLPELYRLADTYLITSPVELQSISTLEAVASGLPVVAVNAGALPELVHDGVNGYLVVHGDWEGAARAVMRILQNENDHTRRSMSARSRELALGHAVARSVEAYEHLLQQTVARSRGGRRIERVSAAG